MSKKSPEMFSWSFTYLDIEKIEFSNHRCGKIGRVVATKTRDPWFESGHWQFCHATLIFYELVNMSSWCQTNFWLKCLHYHYFLYTFFNHDCWNCVIQAFLNGPTPASFSSIFGLFKPTKQFLQQFNVKNFISIQ